VYLVPTFTQLAYETEATSLWKKLKEQYETQQVQCPVCRVSIQKKRQQEHEKSKRHINNIKSARLVELIKQDKLGSDEEDNLWNPLVEGLFFVFKADSLEAFVVDDQEEDLKNVEHERVDGTPSHVAFPLVTHLLTFILQPCDP